MQEIKDTHNLSETTVSTPLDNPLYTFLLLFFRGRYMYCSGTFPHFCQRHVTFNIIFNLPALSSSFFHIPFPNLCYLYVFWNFPPEPQVDHLAEITHFFSVPSKASKPGSFGQQLEGIGESSRSLLCE
jgi:hypothetical protein